MKRPYYCIYFQEKDELMPSIIATKFPSKTKAMAHLLDQLKGYFLVRFTTVVTTLKGAYIIDVDPDSL